MAIPQPGDTHTGFFVQEDRCFRMVYSPQLQSTHCGEPAAWMGRFTDAKGTVHRVWSCNDHADRLSGLRANAGS